MKARRSTVEAQQYCLSAALNIVNDIELKMSVLESKSVIRKNGDNEIKLEPYNNGYNISVDVETNWRLAEKLGIEFQGHFQIYLQPSTFFESDIAEGKGARLEYSLIFADKKTGYTNDRINVADLPEFNLATQTWVSIIREQLKRF